MVSFLDDFFSSLNFYDLMNYLNDSNFYSLLFPFLLAFVLFHTALSRVKIFQNKNNQKPINSVISIISIVASFYGVTYETSNGHNVGELLAAMFPNISALTIGLLALYVVGSMLGKDFFKGVFRKDHTAYLYLSFGVIGFGAVIFYVGIVMGFWDYGYYDVGSYWSFIIAIALLIMGIVFLFLDMIGIGVLFLSIFGLFVYNYGEGNILSYFIDPIVFIVFVVIILFSWLNSDSDKKKSLAKSINDHESSDDFSKNLKDYDSRINDISDQSYKSNVKKWNDSYGSSDSWKNHK